MNGFDSLFSDEVADVELPPGAHYTPDFLSCPDRTRLTAEIDSNEWSQELKRRVQHYGYRYDYKARRIDRGMHIGPLPAFALGMANDLLAVPSYGQESDQLILNEYLPGQGISAHVDCETCFNDRVAIVSLGWPYEMEFQNTQSKSVAKILLGVGSLLVLADEARYQWMHCIRAKLKDRGIPRRRRISMTFRKVLLSPGVLPTAIS